MKKYISLLLVLIFSLTLLSPIEAQLLQQINVDSRFMSVIEINERGVINHFQKNDDARMFPASMTKVMTVYVALQHLDDLEQQITLTSSDFAGLREQGASMAGFVENEIVTVNDLLHGSLLSSGAESTRALARIVSGDETSFVELMNKEAKQLGMNDTNFVNTSGLHDEQHYTTTNDLTKLMISALENDFLKEMMSSLTYQTSPSNLRPNGIKLSNTLNLYSAIGGHDIGHIKGGKTGWTPQAGYCLVSFSEFEDKIVVVISGDGFEYGIQLSDHNIIYHELFDNTHLVEIFQKNQEVATIPLQFVKDIESYPLVIDDNVSIELPLIVASEDLTIEITHPESLAAPIEEETIMGEVNVSYGNEDLYSYTFVNPEIIERSSLAYYTFVFVNWLKTPVVLMTLSAILILLFSAILIFYLVRKHRYQSPRRYYGKRKWRL